MKIIFINVVADGDYQYRQEVPLGILSIVSFLREKSYDVSIFQCFASHDEYIDAASALEADVYCFQLTMVNFPSVQKIALSLKSKFPNSVITVGGPFLSMLYKEIMENEPHINSVVIGEGELTLHEYFTALGGGLTEFSAIQGLVWRNSLNEIMVNQFRRPIKNLDALPFPARDFLEFSQKDPVDGGLRESVRICTSRGCIGRCSFCCVNLFSKMYKGKRWRGRSPKHVVDELELLINNHNAKLFNFSDSSFEDPGNRGKIRAKQICEEIIQRDLCLSAKVYMRCETMRTEEDIDLLRLYKRAGIDVVIIGAEAGSDYELDIYEKNASLEDNYRTATMLKELDLFYVLVGFIMFGPYTTEKTLRSNIDFLHKCGLACSLRSLTNVLMLVKASKLYHRLKEEGRTIESSNYWEQPTYTIEDPVGRRFSLLWQNMFARYPAVRQMDTLQINIGNLISRMQNKMNQNVLEHFSKEFMVFKRQFIALEALLGHKNHQHFLIILDRVLNNASDHEIESIFKNYFIVEYGSFEQQYRSLFNQFISRISEAGFGLSGLVFNNFTSALSVDNSHKIAPTVVS